MVRVKKCKDCVYSRPNNGFGWVISLQRWAMAECKHLSAEREAKHDLSEAYRGVVIEDSKQRLCSIHRQDFSGGGGDCGPDATCSLCLGSRREI